MSFSNPGSFYLLIIVVLFVVVAFVNFQKRRQLLNSFVSDTAFKKLGIRSGREIDFFKTLLMTLALIFFIIALAGPQWGEKFEKVDIKGIEVVFLLDTSTSMNAEDLKPNRFEVAKQLIASIVDNLRTDYISLVNFAGIPYVQCPLTIDYGAFKLMTEASVISPGEEQGTDFKKALELALKTYKSSKSDQKLIVLITDGEDQEKGWMEFLPELKKQKIKIFTVGIGAISGAPIPIKNETDQIVGWKKDKQGNIVKTRLDENTLIQVASQTGGQYFRLSDPSSIDMFVENLKSFERMVLSKKVKLKKIERYQYPLMIGILLLFLELLLMEKRLKWKEK